jgi:hypothetical protein
MADAARAGIRQDDRFEICRHEKYRRALRRRDHAAQLLQRFVDKTPWAHLDIAGTGMGSPQTDINRAGRRASACGCWTGWCADYYEK